MTKNKNSNQKNQSKLEREKMRHDNNFYLKDFKSRSFRLHDNNLAGGFESLIVLVAVVFGVAFVLNFAYQILSDWMLQ